MAIRKTQSGYQVRREFRDTVRDIDEATRLNALIDEAMRRVRRDFYIGLSATIGIREGTEQYCRHIRAAHGAGTARVHTVRQVLIKWADYLSRNIGDVPLDRVSAFDLDLAVDRRLSERGYRGCTISRATVAKEIGILRSYARWASGPARRAPKDMPVLDYKFTAPKDAHHGGEINRMPLDEFVRSVNRIARQSRPVAAILYGLLYFGLRPQALVALKWGDVYLPRKDQSEPGWIRPRVLKKGDPVEVLLPPGSRRCALLAQCRAMFVEYGLRGGRRPVRRDPVFPTRRGRSRRNPRGWTVDTLDKEVRRIAATLGLSERFVAYIGRHSAITALHNVSGVGAGQIRSYAKHRRIETQNTYSHTHAAEPAYEAIERLTGDVFAGFCSYYSNPAEPQPEVLDNLSEVILL